MTFYLPLCDFWSLTDLTMLPMKIRDSKGINPEYLIQMEMWYETADKQFDLICHEYVLQDYLCLVSAHIHMLHRHIMWIFHNFHILDVQGKTSATVAEMSLWFYGSYYKLKTFFLQRPVGCIRYLFCNVAVFPHPSE